VSGHERRTSGHRTAGTSQPAPPDSGSASFASSPDAGRHRVDTAAMARRRSPAQLSTRSPGRCRHRHTAYLRQRRTNAPRAWMRSRRTLTATSSARPLLVALEGTCARTAADGSAAYRCSTTRSATGDASGHGSRDISDSAVRVMPGHVNHDSHTHAEGIPGDPAPAVVPQGLHLTQLDCLLCSSGER
jgi:hypothetical protein